ncbi:MAG: hypothetical protein ABW352_20615, partial [Polyangiales bacterium]
MLALAWLLAVANGCGFTVSAQQCGPLNTPNWIACMLDAAPYRELDSNARSTVYETPTLIRVQHGQACVKAPNTTDGKTTGFRIQDSASVPLALADSGTVYMNGWNLRYSDGDHHVQALGSAIVNAKTTRGKDELLLSWEAGG